MTRRRKYNHGEWELQRERHRLDPLVPPPAPDVSTTLADKIPALMKKWGLENRLWEQQMINEWVALVGEQVAKQARPGRVERKVLYVFVRHPVWLSELARFAQKEMLQKIQARFGADRIRSIRLQVDPDMR